MRVLLLAPKHLDLPDQPKEVADLVSVLDAEVVENGEIKLLAAIKNANFEGVWVSSHADANGVLLDGNERLDAAALAQYLSAVGAKWVVINSCESYEFVDQLQRYYPIDVVAASVRKLGDRPAWRTAALIARHLSKTQNLRAALRLASPGGSAPYRFWPSPNASLDGEDLSMGVEQQLRAEIQGVRADVQRLQLETQREALRENQSILLRLVAIEGKIEVVETMAEAVERKMDKIARPDPPAMSPRVIQATVIGVWAIGIILFAILLLIAIRGAS